MTLPTVTVRVGFDSDPFDAAITWTDISSDVLEIHTKKGRQHELDRIEAGEAMIVLNNTDGNYWKNNTGGSYYPNVKPGKIVNVRAYTTQIGKTAIGASQWDIDDDIIAYKVTATKSVEITKIFAHLIAAAGAGNRKVKCAVYRDSDNVLLGETEEKDLTAGTTAWHEFTLATAVTLTLGTVYLLAVWGDGGGVDNVQVSYDTGSAGDTVLDAQAYDGWPDPLNDFVEASYNPSIYAQGLYDVFTGYVEEWDPGWLARGGRAPIVTMKFADLQKNLARLLLNNAGYAQELSGTRVDNVVAELSANITVDSDAGQSNMIATGAIANKNSMDHLFEVQESELGLLFIAGDGHVQYQDRHARLKSPYTTSQATFGDDSGEMPYSDIDISNDDEFIFNDIRRTRSGGTEQTASNGTSQGDYGTRSDEKDGLLVPTDAEMQDQADYLLKRYKDSALRARTLVIEAEYDSDNLWPKVLSYDLSTRITLRLNQASIDADYHIESVKHDWVSKAGSTWRTTWQLSDASEQVYWAIGVAGLSEIGETTYVAY